MTLLQSKRDFVRVTVSSRPSRGLESGFRVLQMGSPVPETA